MKNAMAAIFLFAAVAAAADETGPATRPASSQSAAVRFAWVDVFVDSGATPLAVYQFELKTLAGDAKIVGVENGDVNSFQSPPYYDPAALQGGRIIVGAFSRGAGDLPKGRSRVARLHLAITGPAVPQYSTRLVVAGAKDGSAIQANISFVEGASR